MVTRRQVLGASARAAAAVGILGGAGLRAAFADVARLPFANGERELVAYPGKRPLLRLTARPPQLETPFSVFDEGVITPNDAFFVRYHLAGVPTEIDPDTYAIEIGGLVNTPVRVGLAELKSAYEPVEITAVNQCSGNSRGLFTPRVGGGQAGNGMMGCAVWKGVPLRALLEKAGVGEGAAQVVFDGLDGPVIDKTPDFRKALGIDHALDGEVMVAYQMNGEDIPWLNGYPVKLVVPGYYGTYWVKHLSTITVVEKPFEDFWMKPAYRVPANACACVEPGTKPAATVPIGRFSIRSFITSVEDGATVPAGTLALRGIAFDGGYGVTEVDVSADGGRSWQSAALGEDLGRYAFREWTTSLAVAKGERTLMVRAVNRIGQSQPTEPLWNPSGYMRDVVETTRITVN
ncbi:molybdopterin-dependent oxidoreductase [Amaricoccus solimangrovi]|uniref:Oxidase n=1 Tax=Amaricoccus solimangrovi TaxID=2589815 RepID=A0A501WRG6_9RHOB|nr:molybdopterin-dependent oxidoreductase [Amaricoccus solimangrovi]TPE50945.1 oxidase [Amaricoccus solimangrovi]